MTKCIRNITWKQIRKPMKIIYVNYRACHIQQIGVSSGHINRALHVQAQVKLRVRAQAWVFASSFSHLRRPNLHTQHEPEVGHVCLGLNLSSFVKFMLISMRSKNRSKSHYLESKRITSQNTISTYTSTFITGAWSRARPISWYGGKIVTTTSPLQYYGTQHSYPTAPLVFSDQLLNKTLFVGTS